jgi:hypothetical protein
MIMFVLLQGRLIKVIKVIEDWECMPCSLWCADRSQKQLYCPKNRVLQTEGEAGHRLVVY